MLASIKKKFVLLSNPKTGSTSLEKGLYPHSSIEFKGPGKAGKHISYHELKHMFGDYFEDNGCTIFVVIRDPIEALLSWYKYRSREAIAYLPSSTRGMTFEQFAKMWNDKAPPHNLRSSVGIALDSDGALAPISYYRYSEMSKLADRLSELCGETITVPHINKSLKFELKYDRAEIAALPRMKKALDTFQIIDFQ